MRFITWLILLTTYSCGVKRITNNNKPAFETIISVNKDIYNTNEIIELTFEVLNKSEEQVSFLLWGTPLENTFTRNCLNIIHNNQVIEYSGRLVKRRSPIESDYTKLESRETTIGKVNILEGYKLNETGFYQIQFIGIGELPISNSLTIEIK